MKSDRSSSSEDLTYISKPKRKDGDRDRKRESKSNKKEHQKESKNKKSNRDSRRDSSAEDLTFVSEPKRKNKERELKRETKSNKKKHQEEIKHMKSDGDSSVEDLTFISEPKKKDEEGELKSEKNFNKKWHLKKIKNRKSDQDSSSEGSFSSEPKRFRHDWFFVVPFVALTGLVVAITVLAVHRCDDPVRYYNGMDSWGHVCRSNIGPPGGDEHTGVSVSNRPMMNRPFLWRVGNEILIDRNITACAGELMTSPLQLCVENCPESLTTVASCHVVLQGNGERERSHRYNATIAQCTRLEELMMKCNFNWSSFENGTNVYNRCLPKNAVNHVYEPMENFLSFWIYVINDFLLSLRVLVVTVFLMVFLSLALCLIITVRPHDAYTYCNILCVGLLLTSSGWHLRTYFANYDFSVSIYQSDLIGTIRVALIGFPLLISVCLIFSFIKDFRVIPGARCILKETSSCLNAMYKIFGLGYLVILSYLVVILILSLAVRYAFTCYNYSTTPMLSSEEIDPLFPYDWVVLLVFGIWLVTIIKITVSTVIAHSVSLWYFSEKKQLRKGWMGCKAMVVQIGAVIGCSLNGCLIHAIATGLLIFCEDYKPITVGHESKKKFPWSDRVFAYLSPYSPACIGVYGHVRPTIISYNGRNWIFPIVGRLQQVEPVNRYQRLIERIGTGRTIQRSHAVLRWYLWWVQVSLTFTAVLVFCVLVEMFDIKLHMLEIDLLIAFVASFYVSEAIFNVLYVAIDATVLCFKKDLSRDPGSNKPLFYSSNEIIFGLTNCQVADDETYLEIERKRQMEKETQLLKEKIKKRFTARDVPEGEKIERKLSFDESDEKNDSKAAQDQLQYYFKAKHRMSRGLGSPNELAPPQKKRKRRSTNKVAPEKPLDETKPAAVAETEPAAVAETEPVAVAETEPVAVDEPKPVTAAKPKPIWAFRRPKPAPTAKEPDDKKSKQSVAKRPSKLFTKAQRLLPRRNNNPPDPNGVDKDKSKYPPTTWEDRAGRSDEFAEIEKELEELRKFKDYLQPRRGQAKISQDSLAISTTSTASTGRQEASKSTSNSWIRTAEVVTEQIRIDDSVLMHPRAATAVVGKKEVWKENKPSSSIDPAATTPAVGRKPFNCSTPVKRRDYDTTKSQIKRRSGSEQPTTSAAEVKKPSTANDKK